MMNSTELKVYLGERREVVEKALLTFLPEDESLGNIYKAMRYSLFAGGKRLRPILCMAGAEAVGGAPEKVLFCGCAMEMIHTYSLIHDDLPGLDDDDYRRGVLTNHKVFGEGMALLAGDGLLTQAMVLLTDPKAHQGQDPVRVLQASQIMMTAAGLMGMVGGQAADLEGEKQKPDLEKVQFIHTKKTGALLTAAILTGAVLGGGNEDQINTLREYGSRIGLAFQIADDLLDLMGDAEAMGKSTGADAAKGKMTYPAVMGLTQARQTGESLVEEAAQLARDLGAKAEPLEALALYIMERTH